MKSVTTIKAIVKTTVALATLTILSACGGGGGGGTTTSPAPSAPSVILYPYETVYGDVCMTSEPTPGCTFSRTTGQRVTVSADPTYDSQGFGSDDLWYVQFDSSGHASVYNDLGVFQYTANPSQFAGYISGSTIGVGVTGLFWENVSSKTYWFGKNGVLYSANTSASNFGQAINNKNAGKSSSVDSLTVKSDKNKALIKAGAAKLVKQYGLSDSKAVAVASALNSWAVMGAERGKVTTQDMDKTFKTVFGVQFNEALAAFKDFQNGDTTGARELTNRSATALGLKPDQAQAFVKGMYKGAIEKMGYKVSDIKW
jgi:uncharacterized protein YfiM (DUF2279 family)